MQSFIVTVYHSTLALYVFPSLYYAAVEQLTLTAVPSCESEDKLLMEPGTRSEVRKI